MAGSTGVIGTQDFRSNINLSNYFPKEKEAAQQSFSDHVSKSADIDTFTKAQMSPLEKDIKKVVKGIQEMVVAYVKGRVPLGDDKFNSTDMLRSMLDMLNASGNMQQVAMQEDSNKMAMQQLYLLMSQQVGREALVKANKFDFKGKSIDFAVDVPEQEGNVVVAINDLSGKILKEWALGSRPGIEYLNWDGLDNEGQVAPKGEYVVQAFHEDQDGAVLSVPLYLPTRIEEVRFDPAKDGRFPVYYSGNKPVKQMLSIYGGDSSISKNQSQALVLDEAI